MNFFEYTSLDDKVIHGLTLLERFVPILMLVGILFLIYKLKKEIKEFKKEKYIRYTIVGVMFLGELSYIIWNYYHSLNGDVRFITTLPLHLCSYAIWGMMYVLLFKSNRVYYYVFIIGIVGALALIFPNLNHGINSFRYYQLYTSHSLLIISLFYMYFVHEFYPSKEDSIKAFLFLQIIIIFSLFLNFIFDAEYLFIGPGNKPIGFAWDWPYHLIQYEAFMGVVFLIVQLIINSQKKEEQLKNILIEEKSLQTTETL